jgi:hypothetical protein
LKGFKLENIEVSLHKGKAKGVVGVDVEVVSVKTSDENWQSYGYDIEGEPTSTLLPDLP